MDSKKHLPVVLVASLLMMVTYNTLMSTVTRILIHNKVYVLLGPEIGYYASNFLMPALTTVVAAIPGFFVLRHYKVPHYRLMSFFAALQAFCFIFAFGPIIGMYATWFIDTIIPLCIVGAYYLTYLIFHNWDARLRYKILAASGMAAVAILIDRLFNLFN